MRNRARITPEAIRTNTIIGNNLRYIRNRRKLTLQRLAGLAGIRYQQIGKYELGVDQLSAYRIYQFSQIFDVKVKYFFDPTYIDRTNGYHTKIYHAAMPSNLLDIDQLQSEVQELL